jgi:transposase InsO family protein
MFQMCVGKAFTHHIFGWRRPAIAGAYGFALLCAALEIVCRISPPKLPQTNGIFECFNGRVKEELQWRKFHSGEEPEATLKSRCVSVYTPATFAISLGQQDDVADDEGLESVRSSVYEQYGPCCINEGA